MSTFSHLPRYPPESAAPDRPSAPGDDVRGAVAIAHVVAELLIVASPLFAILWWIVCLPILLALVVTTAAHDEHS